MRRIWDNRILNARDDSVSCIPGARSAAASPDLFSQDMMRQLSQRESGIRSTLPGTRFAGMVLRLEIDGFEAGYGVDAGEPSVILIPATANDAVFGRAVSRNTAHVRRLEHPDGRSDAVIVTDRRKQ